MLYGLKMHVIEKINTIFTGYSQVEKVILYGSRAKGNFRNGSDIDLVVIGSVDISLLHRIENELDDLYLPCTIDIALLSHIKNESLLDHINRVGIEFYTKSV